MNPIVGFVITNPFVVDMAVAGPCRHLAALQSTGCKQRNQQPSAEPLVAREFALPAVVAAANATSSLVDGEEVTVDGTRGEVTRC